MRAFIVRAMQYNTDSRVMRIAKMYENLGYSVFFLVWDNILHNDERVFNVLTMKKNKKSRIILAIQYLIFSINVFFVLFKKTKKNDVVVFIDLETILVGFLIKYLSKTVIHFDIADPFHLAKAVFFSKLWISLEEFYVSTSNLSTISCSNRLSLYNKKVRSKFTILENIPYDVIVRDLKKNRIYNDKIVLGYFGILEKKYRGIEELIDYVMKDERVCLIIAGIGELDGYISQIVAKCKRIIYYGRFSHSNLGLLMSKIDVYIAFYSKNKKLHEYASPNKYFEHLLYAKPIIISKNVPHSKFVITYDTGWVVENIIEIQDVVNTIFDNANVLKKKKKNCIIVWNDLYKDYYKKIESAISEKLKLSMHGDKI